jgi:hypothetical protein
MKKEKRKGNESVREKKGKSGAKNLYVAYDLDRTNTQNTNV